MSLRKPKIKIIDVIHAVRGEVVGTTPHSFVPKDIFWLDDAYWIGLHAQAWEQDEENWDNTIDGMWGGRGVVIRPSPLGSSTIIRQTVKNLKVSSATYTQEAISNDEIALISAGNTSLLFNISEDDASGAGQLVYEVVDTMTGVEIANGQITKSLTDNAVATYTTPPITFTNGSYIARVKPHVEPIYKLPPGYTIKASYTYIENDIKYTYDPEYNIGRIPSDSQHPLLLLRAEILRQNKQKDKPNWTRYLIGSSVADGEWSSIKIHVGSGIWEYDESILSSVGPVLKRIDQDDPQEVVYFNFDPMARFISASYPIENNIYNDNEELIFEAGSYLLAGNRSSQNGPVLALWHMKKPTISGNLPEVILLAVNENPTTGTGEASLLDHSATSIEITEANKIYILTKSARYTYLSNSNKLLQGGPGGQSLCVIGDKVYHFAENTGQVVENTPSKNLIVDNINGQFVYGEGTPFQGQGCGVSWMNKVWGIYQDKPFSDIKAKQYLAYYDNRKWAKRLKNNSTTEFMVDSGLEFSANDFNWQRLLVANNTLHLFGKRGPGLVEEGDSPVDEYEDGIFAISNGSGFRHLDLDYRVLKVVRTPSSKVDIDGDLVDKVLAIAYKVNKNKFGKSTVDKDVYYVIEIDPNGEPVVFDFNKFSNCFVSNQLTEIIEANPRNTICGPMDVAFIIDDTGSMGGAIQSVSTELNNIFEEIEKVSTVDGVPDYRLSLITFKDDVNVRLNFSKNNKTLIKPLVDSLSADGGGDGPEASDEAVNTAVNLLTATGDRVGYQNIDFTPVNITGNDPGWREDAIKIVILVTDAPAGGFVTGEGGESELMLSVAAQAATKDIMMACVQVGDGYDGGPETLEEVAELTEGAYLKVEQDGVGTGDAIKAIISNCGGRSRPLNLLVIDEFPAYFWWENGSWEQHDDLPTNPNTCILTRSIQKIENENYGYIQYCDRSINRLPEDNDVFLWDATSETYSMLLSDIKRKFFLSSVTELPTYLVWNSVKSNWTPSTTSGSGITPTLTLSSSIVDSSVNIVEYGLTNGTMPYNPTYISYKALEYSGRSPWVPRESNSPILIYNPNERAFIINLEILKHRYGLSITDLPDFLLANEDTGKWDEATEVGSDIILYLEKLEVGSGDTQLIYKVCENCPLLYDPADWYSRGLIKSSDTTWSPCSAEPLQFVYNTTHEGFYSPNDIIVKEYGLSINNLPNFLVLNKNLWKPFVDSGDNNSVSLTLSAVSDGIIYSGAVIPYDARRWESRAIQVGESHYKISSGQEALPVVPEGEDPPEQELEYAFSIEGIESPVFIYNNTKNTLIYNLARLLYDKKVQVVDLPQYLIYTNKKWVLSLSIPLTGQYLERISNDKYVEYKLVSSQGGLVEWPYAIYEWKNRGIREIDGLYPIISLNPPKLVWDNNSTSFTIDRDFYEISYGFTSDSELPLYLSWDDTTKCWAPTNILPTGIYLYKVIEANRILYKLPGEVSLPDNYDLTNYPAIFLNALMSSQWCPATMVAPIFTWNEIDENFYFDLELLRTLYGITDPTSLAEFLIYNDTCWVPGEVNSGDIYLERIINATKVMYSLPEDVIMPYDPTGTTNEGNALRLGWDGAACPVFTCPPYNYTDCLALLLIGDDMIRGNIIEDGSFVPCQCVNAWQCLNSFPPDTKWKVIKLKRHGLPINVIELVDSNIDYRLSRFDRIYQTAWYRIGGPEYGEELDDYLSTFNKRIKFGDITYLKKPSTVDIEIVILVVPKVVSTKLPAIVRLI